MIRLLRRRLWKLLRLFVDRLVVRARYGTFVVQTKNGIIGQRLFESGGYELDLMSRALEAVEHGSLLLDVGANNGVTSIQFLKMGAFESAVAIEPDLTSCGLMLENIALNQLEDRIDRVHAAATDSDGFVNLEIGDTPGDSRVRVLSDEGEFGEHMRRTVKVWGTRIDSLHLKRPDLVWIDVQGHEYQVISGGRNTLKGVPTMVEVWPYGMARAGISLKNFCDLARSMWGVFRDGDALYSTLELPGYLRVIEGVEYRNLLFMWDPQGDGLDS